MLHNNVVNPRALAICAMLTAPRAGNSLPCSDTSPHAQRPCARDGGNAPAAPASASASGRSKPDPLLRSAAGAKFTVVTPRGVGSDRQKNALSTRW